MHVCVINGHSLYHIMLLTYLGKKETIPDMLRSILAQFEYTAQVMKYSSQGIPFNKHLHVSEVNQYSGEVMCQREDEGHIFKVRIE